MNAGFALVLYMIWFLGDLDVVGPAGLDMSVCEEFVTKLLADAAEQTAEGRRFWCAMQLGPLDSTSAHDDRPSLLDLCRYLELDAGCRDRDGIIDLFSDQSRRMRRWLWVSRGGTYNMKIKAEFICLSIGVSLLLKIILTWRYAWPKFRWIQLS